MRKTRDELKIRRVNFPRGVKAYGLARWSLPLLKERQKMSKCTITINKKDRILNKKYCPKCKKPLVELKNTMACDSPNCTYYIKRNQW